MRLSDDKIAHLSHMVFDALVKSGAASVPDKDDARSRRELKQAIAKSLKKEEELEETVRAKVLSYSRKVMEGSQEWDILFQKHYQEELKKRGKA
jgi:uncharacterized protein